MAGEKSQVTALITEPVTAGDATLERAVADAEVHPLLQTLAHITGEDGLLPEHLRQTPEGVLADQGGLEGERLEEAQALALDALQRFRDGGGVVTAPLPDAARLREIMRFAVGDAADDDDLLPVLTAELALDGDPDAPAWTGDGVFSVAIVGAGMSGLMAAYRLGQAGVPYTIIEKNDDVGGTWLENGYPGCRVDVTNHFYSYSFARLDDWPQYFSTRDVLLDYFRGFADEHGLREHVRFSTEVESATFSEADGMWSLKVRGPGGAQETITANAVISAVGQLNRPRWPDIDGISDFQGPYFHSAEWDHSLSLEGKRVVVIGTGASAYQFVPEIADEAASVTVFQRTPPWLVPTLNYHDDVDEGLQWLLRHLPHFARWYRFWQFVRSAEGLIGFVKVDPDWAPKDRSVSAENEVIREMLAEAMKAQVADPELAEKVVPGYPPAAKRMLRDNGVWLATLQRDDVHLVTDPIQKVTDTGVITRDGTLLEADVIIYGTGFQASRFLTPMRVIGSGGLDLHEHWDGEPRAYLGITVPGFPNFFCIYGPNTNIVVNGSIIFFSECAVHYIQESLKMLFDRGARTLDVRRDVHDAFNAKVDADNLTMAWGAADVPTWYKNASGRVTQNWPYSLAEYWHRTHGPDPADFTFR